MNIRTVFIFICSVFVGRGYTIGLSEDGKLHFVELATKYGHKAEQYTVITEDGYILKLFHIPGEIKLPVLLMHGIFDSADTWIIRGNTSLAITLANQGYDVWAGNCRGNRYGRNHLVLDPNTNDEFWDFSFHEFGYYDLSAIIDTVLYLTKSKTLNAIGHSQGNTIFYVLGSTRPEYNDKISVMIALAPICFLQNIQPPLKTIIEVSPVINEIAQRLDLQEILGDNSILIAVWRTLCPTPIVGYLKCVLGIMFPIAGYDKEEFEPSFVSTVVGHFPTGNSRKDLYHFAQVSFRRMFAQYDYGTEYNLAMYNNSVPPEYDLSAVRMKVALLVGANDKLSTVEDVALLRQKLPNVVQYRLLPRRKMNHIDFILGLHMREYLVPYIFEILRNNGGR